MFPAFGKSGTHRISAAQLVLQTFGYQAVLTAFVYLIDWTLPLLVVSPQSKYTDTLG